MFFSFPGHELFYLYILLVEPVLVFSGHEPKGGFTDNEDGGFEQLLVLPNVIRKFLWETFPERGLKMLLGGSFIQVFKGQSWTDVPPLNHTLPLEFMVLLSPFSLVALSISVCTFQSPRFVFLCF